MIAVASALVAVVCGVLLPFAPVVQNDPEIRWRVDTTRPESTMLMLTAYEPEPFTAEFSCRTAREAGDPGRLPPHDDVPGVGRLRRQGALDPGARRHAHRAQRRAGHRGRAAAPRELLVRGGRGRGPGQRDSRRPPGRAAHTAPGRGRPDEVKNIPPDSEPAPKPISALPDIDALSTSLRALPAATASDLAVRITPDDRYASTPSSFKSGLITATVLAVLLGGLATTLAIALGRRRARWREQAAGGSDSDHAAGRAPPDGWAPPPWAPAWWAQIDGAVLTRLRELAPPPRRPGTSSSWCCCPGSTWRR